MKTESIEITLNHYRDKDYECKESKLTTSITINDGTKVIEMDGLRAESFFRMVMDMANMIDKEMNDNKVCCICGEKIEGYGNNPDPVKKKGKCCDNCNSIYVIPARLEEYK